MTMRTRTFLALILIFLLSALPSSVASATSATLGPYEVSFELDADHTFQIQEPVYGKTYTGVDYVDYSLLIDCDGEWAEINVRDHYGQVPAGDDVTRAMTRRTPPRLGGYMILETREQLIDRHSGFLTFFEDVSGKEGFQAAYWLNRKLASGDYLGETSCRIASSCPWTVTNDLLTSIHVEGPLPSAFGEETATLGRHDVSFDLGETSYTVVVEEPEIVQADNQTKYTSQRLNLLGEHRRASIEITDYSEPRTVNVGAEKLLLETELRAGGFQNIQTFERVIDGQLGVLSQGVGKNQQTTFRAVYWPGQAPSDEREGLRDVRCEIESNYKWGTTERLLDTIHVERSDEDS